MPSLRCELLTIGQWLSTDYRRLYIVTIYCNKSKLTDLHRQWHGADNHSLTQTDYIYSENQQYKYNE